MQPSAAARHAGAQTLIADQRLIAGVAAVGLADAGAELGVDRVARLAAKLRGVADAVARAVVPAIARTAAHALVAGALAGRRVAVRQPRTAAAGRTAPGAGAQVAGHLRVGRRARAARADVLAEGRARRRAIADEVAARRRPTAVARTLAGAH